MNLWHEWRGLPSPISLKQSSQGAPVISDRDGSSGPDLIWFRGNAIMFLFLFSCELVDWILCLLHRDLLGFTVILCTDQICPIDWLILQNEGQYVLRQLLNTWLLFGEECGLLGVTDLGKPMYWVWMTFENLWKVISSWQEEGKGKNTL